MRHNTRSRFRAACRSAACGAFAVGIIGAAHAQSALSSLLTVDSILSFAPTADRSFSAAGVPALSIGGLFSSIGAPAVGNDALTSAPEINGAPLGGSSGVTVVQGTAGGFNGFHDGNPPAGTPEPITMGLGIAGLGLAVRRVRRGAH